MAHFAKLDENNIVLSVLVVDNNELLIDGVENEQEGIDFLANLTGHSLWKQTSYNKNFRKNYAGVGYTYDETRDAFIVIKPFDSWVLNEDTCQWEAPVAYPDDGKRYDWNEETTSWDLLE
jgi:hypothetical protein